VDLQKPESDPNQFLSVVMCAAFPNAVMWSISFVAVALRPVFRTHFMSASKVTAVCMCKVGHKLWLEWIDNCEGFKDAVCMQI